MIADGEKIMDLISRKIVMDYLEEIYAEVQDGEGFQYEKWVERFKEIPFVQSRRSNGNKKRAKEIGDGD